MIPVRGIKTYEKDGVRYMDDKALRRKQRLPIWGGLFAILLCAAAVFAIYTGYTNYEERVVAQREALVGQIEYNCKRDVDTSLPYMLDYLAADDVLVRTYLESHGETLYIISSGEYTPGDDMDFYKIPSDLDYTTAAGLLDQGFSSLDAPELSLILRGSWRMTYDRSLYTTVRLRYADFDSGGMDAAIRNAMEFQSFTDDQITSEGVDNNGNTFKEGVISYDWGSVTWRISAIMLNEVYDFTACPEDAVYLGVRLTVNP